MKAVHPYQVRPGMTFEEFITDNDEELNCRYYETGEYYTELMEEFEEREYETAMRSLGETV